MEESNGMNQHDQEGQPASRGINRWLIVAAGVLLAIAVVAFGYGYRQQIMVGHLTAQESAANATINDMQGQLTTLTAKLNEMSAAQQAATQAAAQKKAPAGRASGAKSATGTGSSKQLKELRAQLDQQQKLLTQTQEEVAKNRTDLEGSLNATRDDLNGSIAKTHEELVALAKRGERSYFEFDLSKSKQFQRFGPVTLSLRHTDTKRKNYDLQMIVDDNRLTKKQVNLYEPIWIHAENDSQPVQVVVNRIDKNLIHGYVSAPKYKPSELAAIGTATVTPVAAHPQAPDQNPPTPDQPEQQKQ
jgi:type VI protein secretion system component VasK